MQNNIYFIDTERIENLVNCDEMHKDEIRPGSLVSWLWKVSGFGCIHIGFVISVAMTDEDKRDRPTHAKLYNVATVLWVRSAESEKLSTT